MSKPPTRSQWGDDPGCIYARFTDCEARIWAAEQARGARHGPITVLLVSPLEEDHVSLKRILKSPDFRLLSCRSAPEAEALLRKKQVPVVIAECNLKDCCWKDMWCAIQRLPKRPWPRLIVAAPRTDDRLAREVFNLGACDALAKPFNSADVVWSVEDAFLAWRCEMELMEGAPRAKQAGAK